MDPEQQPFMVGPVEIYIKADPRSSAHSIYVLKVADRLVGEYSSSAAHPPLSAEQALEKGKQMADAFLKKAALHVKKVEVSRREEVRRKKKRQAEKQARKRARS